MASANYRKKQMDSTDMAGSSAKDDGNNMDTYLRKAALSRSAKAGYIKHRKKANKVRKSKRQRNQHNNDSKYSKYQRNRPRRYNPSTEEEEREKKQKKEFFRLKNEAEHEKIREFVATMNWKSDNKAFEDLLALRVQGGEIVISLVMPRFAHFGLDWACNPLGMHDAIEAVGGLYWKKLKFYIVDTKWLKDGQSVRVDFKFADDPITMRLGQYASMEEMYEDMKNFVHYMDRIRYGQADEEKKKLFDEYCSPNWRAFIWRRQAICSKFKLMVRGCVITAPLQKYKTFAYDMTANMLRDMVKASHPGQDIQVSRLGGYGEQKKHISSAIVLSSTAKIHLEEIRINIPWLNGQRIKWDEYQHQQPTQRESEEKWTKERCEQKLREFKEINIVSAKQQRASEQPRTSKQQRVSNQIFDADMQATRILRFMKEQRKYSEQHMEKYYGGLEKRFAASAQLDSEQKQEKHNESNVRKRKFNQMQVEHSEEDVEQERSGRNAKNRRLRFGTSRSHLSAINMPLSSHNDNNTKSNAQNNNEPVKNGMNGHPLPMSNQQEVGAVNHSTEQSTR